MKLESRSAAPELWANPKEAHVLMQRLAALKEEVSLWRDLQQRANALGELLELAIKEQDASLQESMSTEMQALTAQVDELEFRLSFAGRYDARGAILAVHAGAGGTESQDWASMLLRMYLRWGERKRYKTAILDVSRGEEVGIKSATLEVEGPYAYGWLRGERGVHRLVRLSPFDSAHLRHTSFALVEVLPEAEDDVDVDVREEELRIDFYRAGGHGGQNVQKTSTAVRLVHLPTGTTVTCQNERSQRQNRETAMKILKARLIDLELHKRAEEMSRLKGEHVSAEWGNQIRSYVLHPYKLVKDHRTGYESRTPEGVLDGDLEEVLKTYLLSQVGQTQG